LEGSITQLVPQIVPLTLVGCRLSGLFVLAPMLASMAIPGRVKVLLCAVLSVAMWPLVGPSLATVPADIDAFSLLLMCAGEVLVGLVIGALAMLPIAAAQLSGVLIGQQMGMSMATVFNPSTESDSDVTGEIVLHLALAAFLALGGLEVMFLAVAQTFTWIPLGAIAGIGTSVTAGGAGAAVGGTALGGTALGWSPVALTTGLLNSGFDLALRVAAPVIGLVLVETIATAMLIKTIPQMNIMSLGFGFKILIGLLALVAAVRVMDGAVGEHVAESGRQMLQWSAGNGPAALNESLGSVRMPSADGGGR